MKFILIANDRSKKSFFPLSEVLVFAVLILMILYFLYPKDLLQKVLAQNQSAAVTLSYLKAFKKEHQQNPQFMYTLIEQEIDLGQLAQAKLDIHYFETISIASHPEYQSQLHWLNYLLQRGKTLKTKMNTPKRIAYLHQLRDMIELLSKEPLKPQQFKALALDCLWLGKANTALSIYKNLMNTNQLTTAQDYAQGGDIAMQNNAQLDSSKFYWTAYQKAKTSKSQKLYALNAIKALWAGNYVKEAVALADQLPPSLINDRDALLYLSQLALAANQPEIAEKYALKALLLKPEAQHE